MYFSYDVVMSLHILFAHRDNILIGETRYKHYSPCISCAINNFHILALANNDFEKEALYIHKYIILSNKQLSQHGAFTLLNLNKQFEMNIK